MLGFLSSIQSTRAIALFTQPHLCSLTPISESEVKPNPIIAGVKRRYRLGEPEPELSSLSQREQRAILREKMGLPPM